MQNLILFSFSLMEINFAHAKDKEQEDLTLSPPQVRAKCHLHG